MQKDLDITVLTVGELTKFILKASLLEGKSFKTNVDCAKYIVQNLKPDTTILLKASRFMKFEEIIETVKNYDNDIGCFSYSACTCIIIGCPILRIYEEKMYGQYIREEVKMLHEKKNKTPTTGGVFIVASIVTASIIALFMAQELTTRAIIVLMTLIFYTFTGFEDDIKKLKKNTMKA